MSNVHESHLIVNKYGTFVCVNCFACKCHNIDMLAKPCYTFSNDWDPEPSPVDESFEPHKISTKEFELKSGRIVLIVACSCDGFDVIMKWKVTANSLAQVMTDYSDHLRKSWGC